MQLIVISTLFLFTGWLVEATDSYNGSFYLAAVSFLLCGPLTLLIPLSWHCTLTNGNRNIGTESDLEIVVLHETISFE